MQTIRLNENVKNEFGESTYFVYSAQNFMTSRKIEDILEVIPRIKLYQTTDSRGDPFIVAPIMCAGIFHTTQTSICLNPHQK